MAKNATLDGIATRYEIVGEGPPLLMYAPGGFDATLEKWRTLGVYERIKLLEHLPKKYICIVFDRRECGQSGGRVEQVTWRHYADHGKALLDHLKIKRAHLMGGCMGCSCVLSFAVSYPEACMPRPRWCRRRARHSTRTRAAARGLRRSAPTASSPPPSSP